MDQINIGNAKGLKLDRLPFNIDNNAFATMFNMYSWRGRAKRKRGTLTLDRLKSQIQSVLNVTPPAAWQKGQLALVAGAGNIISGFGLETDASIVPGSISFVVGANTYTEPATPDGTLVGAPAGSGTINYATGAVTISGGGVGPLTGTFSYYPDLPVLGLEDMVSNTSSAEFPLLHAFDTTYSYQVNQVASPSFYSTSYYKITNNPVTWSNTDDNQFWSANYQSAFWVTNNKPGFHFAQVRYIIGNTFEFKNASGAFITNLVIGDVLFFNEWSGISNINGVNGTISVLTNPAAGQYDVALPGGSVVAGSGIAQLLTNSIAGQDGIRWYDGDPTGGTGLPTGTNLGWVNFAPPLTATTVSINDQSSGLYYLVGALAIIPFKDRLLFLGPQIQTSTGSVIQRPLQDTVLWSWNGTPYYNALVPTNSNGTETYDVRAYYVDQTGFGGYLPAGVSKPIGTAVANEDVILIGFGGSGKKTRFVYTNNDLQPFVFYSINSQFPSNSTFSGLAFDDGAVEVGDYGITLTTQQKCDRIDDDIPDEVFQIQAKNNGQNRVNAVRDFFRKWAYFSYPTGDGKTTNGSWKYPSQSFLWNYSDHTWAILRENFTHHGTFRRINQYTWATLPFKTWAQWREPWNAGSSQALFPSIIAGNPQGYVVIKGEGTSEAPTGVIAAIANDGMGNTQITSVNHCVNSGDTGSQGLGDYLYFQSCIGSTYLNGQIGLVISTPDADTFVVDIPFTAGTYLGLGTYTRLSQPLLQTKQFPFYWAQGRKVRLMAQKYLLDRTANAQATITISLSQDPDAVYNSGNIVPDTGVTNSSLIYSQLIYTCPEDSVTGLTAPNFNLQMPTAPGQFQIWHRMNTSLIGDSVQIGLTLSDTQMRNLTYATSEIALHGMQLNVAPGPLLA